jgi:hypothetical protein
MVSTGGVIQQLADNQYSPDHMKTLIGSYAKGIYKYHMPNRGAPDCGSKSRDQHISLSRSQGAQNTNSVACESSRGGRFRSPNSRCDWHISILVLTFTVPYSWRAAPRARVGV